MAETAVEGNIWVDIYKTSDNQSYKRGHARTVMKTINMARFQQNPKLLAFLKNTAQVLVEANSYDKCWGVGSGSNDKNIQ